jgi:DNA-binding MarR family transcriptional regulator
MVLMNKTARAKQLKLSWDEIGYLTEGFSFASRPMKLASENITAEFSLGPRGAWIMILIKNGQVYPLDLANVFRIGRSLITAELIPLTDARLITYRKSAGDKRRVELALTPLGERAVVRIREGITRLVLHRLSGYTREEVLLCARLLHDFISSVPGTPIAPSR